MHPIGGSEHAGPSFADQKIAKQGYPAEDLVDGIGGNDRPRNVQLVFVQIDPALGGDPQGRTVGFALVEAQVVPGFGERHNRLVEGDSLPRQGAQHTIQGKYAEQLGHQRCLNHLEILYPERPGQRRTRLGIVVFAHDHQPTAAHVFCNVHGAQGRPGIVGGDVEVAFVARRRDQQQHGLGIRADGPADGHLAPIAGAAGQRAAHRLDGRTWADLGLADVHLDAEGAFLLLLAA